MVRILRILTLILVVSVILSSIASAYGNEIVFYWEQPYAIVNAKNVSLNNKILRYNRATYIPVEDMLGSMGYALGWDSHVGATTAYKDGVLSYIIPNSCVLWKGENQYISPKETIIYNEVFYMPLDMFEYLTGDNVEVTEVGVKHKYQNRDMMLNTYVSHQCRLFGEVKTFNNVSIIGNYGMMTEGATEEQVESYIKAVNLIANTAPVDVNIYNIVVPTSSEFYGPSGVSRNQTEYIKTIYSGLSQRVMPINVITSLSEHIDEYLYFRTDHHWTQRGAYYAYKEFIQIKGEEAPYLADFEANYSSFTGSLVEFTKGTEGEMILSETPDVLEKFMPFHYVAGAAYSDMYMKNYLYPLKGVYDNYNSYMAYIGGDNPLSVFITDVNNGKKILIIKESYGNAFATWALNNYSEVYVVDPRAFNKGGEEFNLNDFYKFVKCDDLVIINSASSLGISDDLVKLVY